MYSQNKVVYFGMLFWCSLYSENSDTIVDVLFVVSTCFSIKKVWICNWKFEFDSVSYLRNGWCHWKRSMWSGEIRWHFRVKGTVVCVISNNNNKQPPAIPSSTPQLASSPPWTPVGLVIAGCWQINSILFNIGRRNYFWSLNQYLFFWNALIWAQFICFIKFFAFWKLFKVAMISCRWSKARSKAGENNGLIRPLLRVSRASTIERLHRWAHPVGLGLKLKLLWLPQLGASWLGYLGLRHVLPMIANL